MRILVIHGFFMAVSASRGIVSGLRLPACAGSKLNINPDSRQLIAAGRHAATPARSQPGTRQSHIETVLREARNITHRPGRSTQKLSIWPPGRRRRADQKHPNRSSTRTRVVQCVPEHEQNLKIADF
jgi:hypothetical protein